MFANCSRSASVRARPGTSNLAPTSMSSKYRSGAGCFVAGSLMAIPSARRRRQCGRKGLAGAGVGQLAAIGAGRKNNFVQFLRAMAEAQGGTEPHLRVSQPVGAAHDAKQDQASLLQAQVRIAPEQAEVM